MGWLESAHVGSVTVGFNPIREQGRDSTHVVGLSASRSGIAAPAWRGTNASLTTTEMCGYELDFDVRKLSWVVIRRLRSTPYGNSTGVERETQLGCRLR